MIPMTILAAAAAIAGVDTVDVTRGPYLQCASPTSMTVRWRTDTPSEGRVWFGTSTATLAPTPTGPLGTEHEVVLDGLTAATRYYYAVGTASQVLAGGDDEHTFLTPPRHGTAAPTRVWVLGDSGSGGQGAAAVRDAYYASAGAPHTDLWLMLGDNAYPDGTDEEYQRALFDMYPEMLRTSCLWTTRGNHDRDESVYYGAFTLPRAGESGGVPSGTEAYYSFDHANVHFICLDSFRTDPTEGQAMWTWLDMDAAAHEQEWTIAFWHHPPYSKGSHDSDTEDKLIRMREEIVPLLEEHGIDLVLCGHSHSYERSYLIDGHHGLSTDFGPQHLVDGGSGDDDTTGAYRKQPGANAGAVFMVAGASAHAGAGGGSLDHPAMFVSTATRSSVVLDFDGGRLDVTTLSSSGSTIDRFTMFQEPYHGTYCVPSPSGVPCPATIRTLGLPSIGSSDPFLLEAPDVGAMRTGLFFFGTGETRTPLIGGGLLCVGGPFTRTPSMSSTGVVACEGVFQFDFNQHLRSLAQPSAMLGSGVYGQFWYREPTVASGYALSDAVQFTVGP